jgi:hypothetical protein
MTQGIIVSPANRGVQVVVTDENNVQLLVDSNRGVSLEIVPQPRIEVLVDKGVEGAQGPVGPQGPQGPQGTAATVAAGTTTTGLAGTNAIVTNSGTSSAAVFDFTIPRGDTGATGATGAGVAVGGTTGQVLVKASGVNYDTTWATITGTLVYQGSWNAATNTPTLTSSVGTNGYYYVVGTSGSTNLNGITDWVVGDWAIFNGTIWQKIDNTDLVSSVNGQTGVVVLTASSVGALAIANNLSDLTSNATARTNLGLGSIATQNANAVAITGGTIDNTVIGGTTPAAGTFTTLTATGQTSLGGATGSESVRILSPVATGSFVQIQSSTDSFVEFRAAGTTSSNNSLGFISRGTGAIGFFTNNSTSTQQFRVAPTASAVNYVQVTGAATGGNPNISAQGSDSSISVNLTSKGAGDVRLITGGSTGWVRLFPNGTEVVRATGVASGVNYINFTGSVAGTSPSMASAGSDTNIDLNLTPKGTGVTKTNGGVAVQSGSGTFPSTGYGLELYNLDTGSNFIQSYNRTAGSYLNTVYNASAHLFRTSGAEQLRVSNTSSAVNYVQVTGAATGGHPTISSQGSDSNARLILNAKGTSSGIDLLMNNARQMFIGANGLAVNYLQTGGTVSGIGLALQAQGSDTNIAQVFQSKGTGAIDLAAGSSGVNISNGGTVTAITRTASGSGYTSVPSAVISAPTTAGGTQATLSPGMTGSTATVVAGGTGYTVGDTLTIVGATGTASQLTVATLSGSAVATVTFAVSGNMTALPTNPVSVTGGTGSGATFTMTYALAATQSSFTAGSGYVEQPTVSFSGGGGSGAAAYATVGSGTVVKGLGTNFDVFTANANRAFRFYDSNSTGVNYWSASNGTTPVLYATGSSNTSAAIITNGTGSVSFQSAGGTTTQMQVSHTASAVNYVQVTGAATGGAPNISVQGSDTNAALILRSKGTFACEFQSSAGTVLLQALPVASSVNYLRVSPAVTGGDPVLSAQGSDTNIDLVLQPKGTGALQAQQTDSTATGGNARGARAVDWQTSRSSASQVASGSFSVVGGGSGNSATTTYSAALSGLANTSSGVANVTAGGLVNVGSGIFSAIVGGGYNTSGGWYNFIGGGFTNSGTANAAVTTQSGTMNGTTAVTLSGSNASIKVGQIISGTSIGDDTYVAAISGTSLTLSKVASGSSTSTLSFFTPHGVVVGGGNNQATGSYSFIGGGGDAGTASNRNVASGDWSSVVGGLATRATGKWSTAGGGVGNLASGEGSVVAGGGSYGGGGAGNTASSVSTFVGAGYFNTAAGYCSSVVGGVGNVTSNNFSFVGGGTGNSANTANTAILGGVNGTTRSIDGMQAMPACNAPIAATQGCSQAALLVLGVQTTDATATILRSNTSAASGTNQIILPNNSAYAFKGTVIANVTGGGNTKAWAIEGAIKRGANAASTALVGTPTVTSAYADAGASTWAITATADTTNGGLAITFTGQASTTIRCVAKLETTEVTF